MESVMISIQPKWCELIASGSKTIEIRKSRPSIFKPFRCYVYCTKTYDKSYKYLGINREEYFIGHNCGKVIGEFICNDFEEFFVYANGSVKNYDFHKLDKSMLSMDDIYKYIGAEKRGYAWNISELKIYDKPKQVSEFGMKRPPQSWCYYRK